MAVEKLTKDRVRKLAPAEKSYIVWDADDRGRGVSGLGVRVQPSGVRTYILKYRAGRGRGAPIHKPRIGSATDLTLDQARTIARRWKAGIAEGRYPSEERKARAAEQKAKDDAPTVADLARDYLERHAVNKRTGNEDRRRLDRNVLPRLGRKKVAAITHRDIEDLHREIGERAPYEANRTIALLSKMFSFAIRWQWRLDNPAKGIERYHEDRRHRFLSPAEIARLSEALAAHPDQIGVAAIRLLLLTGARKGEVLSMSWAQLDLERGIWTKPSSHTKTKKEHRVPLSPPARQLLQAMPRAGEYVFPGRRPGEHREGIRSTWADVCAKAGIEGVRVHDLRHSFASLLVSSGLSLPVIGALLGHATPTTTARYAHLADDPLREAMERVGKLIENGNDEAEVIPLAGAR